MPNDRILSTLSLAQKAGQVKSGEFAVEKAVKEYRASLVIVAQDASENTKKKMKNIYNHSLIQDVKLRKKKNLKNKE